LCPGLNENDKQDWDQMNQWFLSLRNLGVAVIFVHHAGKGGEQRGTSAREDSLDNVIRLDEIKSRSHRGACFKVKFEKHRNLKQDEYVKPCILNYRNSSRRRGTVWEVEEDLKGEHDSVIMALLVKTADDPDWNQGRIAEAVGKSQGRISQMKKAAMKKGLLDKRGEATQVGLDFSDTISLEGFY